MTSDKREWTQSRDALVNAITSLGYPVEFGKEIAKNLGSPKAMYRMTVIFGVCALVMFGISISQFHYVKG